MTTETLWKVTAEIGRGYPVCTGRERKTRRFASERAAADWVATILAMSGHHRLISVERGTITYDPSPPFDTDYETGQLRLPDVACGGCGTNLGAPDAPTYEPVCPHCGSRARFLDRSRNDE